MDSAAPSLSHPDGNSIRVMLVEDDALVRRSLEDLLDEHGATVMQGTERGEAAIALVAVDPPDVVLMDISLRGPMDGITAAEQIIERYDVPIVFVSGNADKQTQARIALLNGPELVGKPAPVGAVVDAVRRACKLDG